MVTFERKGLAMSTVELGHSNSKVEHEKRNLFIQKFFEFKVLTNANDRLKAM